MSQQILFGRYRFEPATARLWADQREIKVTRKAAAVLGLLVERAGQPVAKQELFASVWGNVIVSDDALTTCVQELRKALGDDARQPRYIETRHRYGYCFVAELTRETPSVPAGAVAAATQDPTAIAVLPFMDMSPGRDQDYFCEGLAEELIDALTHVDGLRVSCRSCSFQFRGDGVDLREVGRQLGVGSIVAGSVRRAGDQLRITVQLVDVATGYHKWSQRFERQVGDVFAVQDEIAGTVATTLRGGAALTQREQRGLRRPQTTTEPYERYLRGRQCLHRMAQVDLDQSRRMFEGAIELDADYAPAWAGLATVHALLYEWWGSRDEDLHRTERASQIAMELAPDLADAHVARGFALSLHRRYDEAQVHFEFAARINPHLFDAYYYYGRTAFAHGEVERSVELFRKAGEVRQEDFQSIILMGQSLRMLGRVEEARAADSEGVRRAERILALNPADGRALSMAPLALFNEGDVERAMQWSRRAVELYPDDLSALINCACLNLRTGNTEAALDVLERVFGRGWGKRDWVEHDPDYDIVRDHPRFKALLAKLK
ncbi:MAG TPA: winged helix-turn-helix domain-containing protein [Steroidobacteraceae bacterium]|nr:winged helix-turn-helix domain-containing protein [Steroidobacteraceae bacterium]